MDFAASGKPAALRDPWGPDIDATTVAAGLDWLFDRPDRPTALLAMSDKIALCAIEWLAARGMAVPDDISVIGFDGVPEGETATPPLTTIVQPMVDMGRRAVNAILDHDGAIIRDLMPIELLVRGSTGAPRP